MTEIGDRVTVLRDGEYVDQVPASVEHSEFVRLMVGPGYRRPVSPAASPKRETCCWRSRTSHAKGVLEDISFEVRAGEVVGVSGIVGAGRTELAEAIFGAEPADSGEVVIGGPFSEAWRSRRSEEPGHRLYYRRPPGGRV